MTKHAVVTGATGYIGPALVTALLDAGWKVTCVLKDLTECDSFEWGTRVSAMQYDGHVESLKTGVSWGDAVVFHLAAVSRYDCPPEMIEEMLKVNVIFGIHLVDAMRHHGASRIVNTGSFWQFDKDGARQPICFYASTKQAFQDLLATYTDISSRSLILFDVYGPGDPRKRLVTLLTEAAKTGERLALSPGMQKIDLVHLSDVVSAFLCAAHDLMSSKEKSCQTLPVCTHRKLTIRDLAKLVEELAGRRIDAAWGERPYRDRELMEPWSPPKELHVKGWSPRCSIEEGIRQLL